MPPPNPTKPSKAPLIILPLFVLLLLGLSWLGTRALALPACHADHAPEVAWHHSSWIATAAVTNTGIDPIRIERSLSPTGRAVVLALMQIGAWVWLIAGGALMLRGHRDRLLTLANVVICSSVLIEGLSTLLLWPTMDFASALFTSVSAFTGTGFTSTTDPHPIGLLAVLGPVIVIGQVLVIGLDGVGALARAIVVLAALFLLVAIGGLLTGDQPLWASAWRGLSHPTGFDPHQTPGVAWASYASLFGGAVWLIRPHWRRAAVAVLVLVVSRGMIAALSANEHGIDWELAVSAVSHSGVASESVALAEHTAFKPLQYLMLIGRCLPLLLLAWVCAGVTGAQEKTAA